MTRFDPKELEEDVEPERWPVALIASVLLHAGAIAAVVAAFWPEQTSVSAARDGQILSVMRPQPPADVVVEAPATRAAVVASPLVAPPVVAAPAPPIAMPPAAIEPPATRFETVAATPPPPPQVEPARPAGPRPSATPSRAAAPRPSWQARAEPAGNTPSFDSPSEWFRAMARMRHGDFAPHRRD